MKNNLLKDGLDCEHALNCMPGICFIKDLEFRYIYANQAAVNATRFLTKEEISGRSDFEMPWPHLAEKFKKEDAWILAGNNKYTVEETPALDDTPTSLVLLKKSPFYNRNSNIQGVFCFGFELSKENFLEIFSLLKVTNMDCSRFVIVPNEQKRDYIYGDLKFSKRQAQVIHYLLKGYSRNSIAKQLNLSSRTIEFYLKNIREKLQCKNKMDIVNRAFEVGFIDLMFWEF